MIHATRDWRHASRIPVGSLVLAAWLVGCMAASELELPQPIPEPPGAAVGNAPAEPQPVSVAGRALPFEGLELSFADDIEAPVQGSVFSLSSAFFEPTEVAGFLRAVRARAPERTLVVLVDPAFARLLAPLAEELALHLVEVSELQLSPWPRDPFSFARRQDGDIVLVARPNVQPGREDDTRMAEALVERLPDEIVRAWGKVAWTRAPAPFHNGQLLLTPERAWVSLHTLELRVLELLDEQQVPVASFGTPEGIDRYLAAARQAAAELEELYQRPVAFVHPLPEGGSASEREKAMRRLGGGAGYDLDSWLTFLPASAGGFTALVADLEAGAELLEQLPESDWRALRQGYDLGPSGLHLRRSLATVHEGASGRALGSFLDLVAEHLAQEGVEVRRVPLLLVPLHSVRGVGASGDGSFLISWNNVVVERRSEQVVAEGFTSLLERGDELARRIFADSGSQLELLPALVESVIRNGGYRCASNHLRAIKAPAAP